jgi:site-specific recombinase XerD
LFEAVLDKGWNDRKIAYLRGYKPLPSVLEKSQIFDLINSIEKPVYKAIFTTIYSSGLRIQEAINLRISDIDSKRMQIHIRESKNGSARNAILSEKNLELLRIYIKTHPLSKSGKWNSEDYVFCISSREKPICSKTLRKVLNQAVEKLKINQKITVHTLRHSFASHLLEEGVNIFAIKELLGHRSISSTSVYLHVVDARKIGGKSPFDTDIGGIRI